MKPSTRNALLIALWAAKSFGDERREQLPAQEGGIHALARERIEKLSRVTDQGCPGRPRGA